MYIYTCVYVCIYTHMYIYTHDITYALIRTPKVKEPCGCEDSSL